MPDPVPETMSASCCAATAAASRRAATGVALDGGRRCCAGEASIPMACSRCAIPVTCNAQVRPVEMPLGRACALRWGGSTNTNRRDHAARLNLVRLGGGERHVGERALVLLPIQAHIIDQRGLCGRGGGEGEPPASEAAKQLVHN